MLENFDELTKQETDKVKIRVNFHTHNYLCGHAKGTVSDYVAEAVENGLKTIGISDHLKPPVGPDTPYISPETVSADYLPQFEEARSKFGDKIQILSGGEIEYFSGHNEYYENFLSKLDYLILGQHVYFSEDRWKFVFTDGIDEENVSAYFEHILEGIDSGFFSLIAHPDAIFESRGEITEKEGNILEEAVRRAVKKGIPLELNANGIRWHGGHYPTDLLIRLCKKYNAKVVVSADCHAPADLCDENVKKLYAYAKKMNLNVVDEIPLRKSKNR